MTATIIISPAKAGFETTTANHAVKYPLYLQHFKLRISLQFVLSGMPHIGSSLRESGEAIQLRSLCILSGSFQQYFFFESVVLPTT